ncbi:MAG TPA: LytTR family DNA-binding domain-containing protein [Pyrinomonadaceae bacterium]|nr:LytTR family DNA-binding domain-containing protein [Pyrinomonadaceae bacterium]
MMKIQTLIVDDERIAREGIRMQLENDPEVEIVGECANGVEAVSFIKKQKPDLVFLDVQMPGLDGFGVIEKVGTDEMPMVIFVTAYDKYALRAFEVHAFDYLLKPSDDERFARALQRAKAQLRRAESETVSQRFTALLEDLRTRQENIESSLKADRNRLEKIVVKTAGRIFFVNAEEIDWFEAADNYVKLHVGRETHLVRETVSRLESRLDPNQFLRIHRSIIVNVERIKELHPLFNGVFSIRLKDGTELTSGRGFRKNLARFLGE